MESDARPTIPSREGDTARRAPLATRALGYAAFAIAAALTLYLAAAPVFTNDFWFHLKMGEVYAHEGPWPAADPMLFTAHERAPVQHEWLFGVAMYGIERAFGFAGVRVFHALAVLAILALVVALARRASGDPLVAAAVGTVFAILSWTRLFQLRPDLVSIPATLVTVAWFASDRRRIRRRTWVAFAFLVLVWANVHSLFALGPLLLIAALPGVALRSVGHGFLLRGSQRGEALRRDRTRAASLVAAIGISILVSLVNPRGIDQLSTFASSSRDAAIWTVKDEWSPFDPFTASNNPGSVSPLLWGTMDGVALAFALTSVVGFWAIVRRRPGALHRFDPVAFGVGLASVVAISISVRFLWLAIFPLLFIARAIGRAELRRDSRELVSWALALGSFVLVIQFYRVGGFEATARRLPSTASEYVSTPYLSRKFHVEGVRFLRDTRVEGRLFNDYGMGGFLGYWLAPKLRTFIDGRTEHYPPEVVRDYARIRRIKELGGRRTVLDLLDRHEVDFFFGTGLPTGRIDHSGGSTTGNLEGAPGWVPVSRSLDHAIYLRDLPRNEANFERIARYYASQGIPFDRERGFDAAAAIETDLDWAVVHELVTPAQARRIAGGNRGDRTERAAALEARSLVFLLGGSYDAALAIEAERDQLAPATSDSLRRRVYAHMKLEQPEAALEAALALVKANRGDAQSLVFQQLAIAFAELSRASRDRMEPAARRIALARVVQRVPLLTSLEAGVLLRAMPGEPRVDGSR